MAKTIDIALTYATDALKRFDEAIYQMQSQTQTGNTSATGGLDTPKPPASSGGGSSSGSSGGSSSSSSGGSSSSSSSGSSGMAGVQTSFPPYTVVDANGATYGSFSSSTTAITTARSVASTKGITTYVKDSTGRTIGTYAGSGGSSSSSSGSSSSSSSSSSAGKWMYTITQYGKYHSEKKGFSSRAEAQSAAAAAVKSVPGGKYTTKQYALGGLVDYTGPAWVDGTKSKPEAFLSGDDTALMRDFIDYAHACELGDYSANVPGASGSVRNDNVTIESVEVVIESGVIDSRANAAELGSDIASELMKIARQSGNISVTRR